MRIIIDPGHGGPDAGTRDPGTGLTESYANFITSLTLKHVLLERGWKTLLTRIDDRDVDNYRRATMHTGDVFVSVHYDWPQGRSLVYYPAFRSDARLMKFGQELAKNLGVRALPSTSSRFGRLYIDDVPSETPAVIWEVDVISSMEPSTAYRLDKCSAFADALAATRTAVW